MTEIQAFEFHNTNIHEQLQVEEAALRTQERNYFFLNQGSNESIVMGISGKLEELVDKENYLKNPLPIIRRFSGGGTVLVNRDTVFVTFILEAKEVGIQPYPEALMQWTAEFYSKVFAHCDFALRENDYVIGDRKFGGNAQYIRKGRVLHHSSFLWDYSQEAMSVLTLPKRIPQYRKSRNHSDFLCPLKEYFSSKNDFIEKIRLRLSEYFSVSALEKDEVLAIQDCPHRKATKILEWDQKIFR